MIVKAVTLWTPAQHGVTGQLAWSPRDPVAVRLCFRPPGRGPAVQHLSRQLLAGAMARSPRLVGEGTVRVQVTADAWMEFFLARPEGVLALRCSAPTVWEVLDAAQVLVPRCPGCGPVQCPECVTVGVALDKWLLTEVVS